MAETLRLAQALILAGDVVVDEQRCDKPGTLVSSSQKIRLKEQSRFVSRGGDKLYAAIQDFDLASSFQDAVVLDVGASTGGFTDCCLQLGAKLVFSVDVGTNQLAWQLRQHEKVKSYEQTDIKEFNSPEFSIDWIICDVSFTSLAKLVPEFARIDSKAQCLLLVKPQFELPQEFVPAGGVIENDDDRQHALDLVRQALSSAGYNIKSSRDSQILGRNGNREIFVWASPK